MKFSFFSLFILSSIPNPASASVAAISPVYIENVSVIEQDVLGHRAGNLEIRIKGGFTRPAELTCGDSVYVTTSKSGDPQKRLFALLTLAKITQQPLMLHISDDPQYLAMNGRCSLVAATLL